MERLLRRGGKNCYLDLPAIFKDDKANGASVDLLDLLAVIDARIAPIQNVQGVVIFGSTMTAHIEYEERLGLFNRKKRAEKLHQAIINDIDIFVLLQPGTEIKRRKVYSDASSWHATYGYSGPWISREVRQGALDIFAMTATEFSERLEAGDSEARSILDQGALVLGSFPFVLRSSSRVDWSRRNNPNLIWNIRQCLFVNRIKQSF